MSKGNIAIGRAHAIYAVLCAGFLVSLFYRVSNAVIAPELMRSLAISAEAMGVITGMYFLVFAVAQIPTGVLLDRFGPRRTMSSLFFIAVAGSIVFASAEGAIGLGVGRGLMGLGFAAGLMGAMVAIARWFPADRFARLASLLYTVGGVGLLLASTPLAAVADAIGWRGAFMAMAVLTGLIAVLLYLVLRDAPPGAAAASRAPETPHEIWMGLKTVFANRALWRICAIQFVNYGTVLAVVGLWAGPYLNDVHGLAGVSRGNALLALNVATLCGVMLFSAVERWIDSRKWTIAGGAFLSVVVLLVLALVPGLGLWPAAALLVVYAVVSAYVMLIHSHARAVLPDHLVGRGLTLQNVAVFLGVFVIQSLSGVIVGAFDGVGGAAPEAAYRAVFGFLAAMLLAGTLVYLRVRDVRPRAEGRVAA
jgi:predicted MFS family arabinose efflux permease